jgi:glycosyltransferase involved in cell wall biosynthesis
MGESLLFPVIVSKLLRKPIILCLAASSSKMMDSSLNNHLILQVPKFLELFNYYVSDFIILYSSKLIKEWNLSKYTKKIYIAQKHFLNFNLFNMNKKIDQRPYTVGYIGRLSDEKGSINFVQAIPIILSTLNDVRFFIGGDGPLKDNILEEINNTKVKHCVKMEGWINHNELPKYLNEMKLLVIPSYTEGLPNIMLEAMACGTPVLSTSVGAISDVITDNVTGFIMENNSPNCIAKNVVRALKHPYLSDVSKNAYNLVTQNFTYEMAKEKYYRVFKEIVSKVK